MLAPETGERGLARAGSAGRDQLAGAAISAKFTPVCPVQGRTPEDRQNRFPCRLLAQLRLT